MGLLLGSSSSAGNIGGFGNASKRIAASKRPKKAKIDIASQTEKDDVASTLLSSLCDSGKGVNVGKFLRMAMKGAVAKSYEASRAAMCATTVNQGDISFKKVSILLRMTMM